MADKTYFDNQLSKAPGGTQIDNFKKKYLDPWNIVGDPGDVMNLGASGYQTAVDAAKAAQAQANQLSALQWQRQMQGLQGAQGYTNNLQSLYNSLYGPGNGQPAAGGQALSGPTPAQMSALSAAPAPPSAPTQSSGSGSSDILKTGNKIATTTAPLWNPVAGGVAVYDAGKAAYNYLKGKL